jgi:hypothetical protein
MRRICGACGQSTSASYFCPYCGARLKLLQQHVAGAANDNKIVSPTGIAAPDEVKQMLRALESCRRAASVSHRQPESRVNAFSTFKIKSGGVN